MSLFLIVLTPFLGALLPALIYQTGRHACFIVTFFVTLTALVGLISQAPAVLAGEVVQASVPWLPQIGLNVALHLDALALFFAGLILFIGLLIITYARWYLSRDDHMGEFFTYLLLFQGAMVGITLSDNILLLLVFWELTSLSSFLLIGYWKHLEEGRQGARMALTVTGMGGLAMIGGMLLLGEIAGSYEISDILQNREAIQASPLYVPALLLILLGCFTKSAQFPFHFWLPHAMAAPTPVSAYLHSATMVKAGIFLLARLWPVLSGSELYFYLVTGAGIVTMVIGAVVALFKHDLKALLAFSTISHLGLIVMCLGTGTAFGVLTAVFHIINHATFKATLFMVAGIVDHEAGTRDIRRLGGLRRLMPITATLAFVGGLSMAGMILFNGFLSKEMWLKEAEETVFFDSPYVVIALAALGSLFSAAYSFRFMAHTFLGAERDDYPAHPHDPPAGMWLPPALLAVLVVVIGVAPFLAEPTVYFVTDAILGSTAASPDYHLAIWHGVNLPLMISAGAIVGGVVLVAIFPWLLPAWERGGPPFAKAIFDSILGALVRLAQAITQGLHNGAFSRYAAIFVLTVVAAAGHAWVTGTPGGNPGAGTPITPPALAGWVLLIGATVVMTLYHHNRFFALVMMAIVGLIVSVGFAYLSAPDLAMTQISVEVVTLVLLLLALNFLPKRTPKQSSVPRKLRDFALAGIAGLATFGLSWHMMLRDFVEPSISQYHLDNSYKGGGGDNVVNVILVDFRGFDTFGEIIVLGIAALVIYALCTALLNGPVRARLINRTPDQPLAGDIHPLMMVVMTRVIMPVVLVVGVYIFLRGHNQPGGGFISGLVVAIAVVMQYMASGYEWTTDRQRFPYHGIIGAGVVCAALTGIGSFFVGHPFLTSAFGYVDPPYIAEFELATALAFDLGVFLAVLGAVLLSLDSFARLARRSETKSTEEPMDIDPSRVEAE